uniref:Uncharacterized protein n=1 Tax=Rhizophora mucronata TaxID=61149 RepID=A0A2P2MLG2_RHIMU
MTPFMFTPSSMTSLHSSSPMFHIANSCAAGHNIGKENSKRVESSMQMVVTKERFQLSGRETEVAGN